jgi:hypothetical protein
MEEDFYEYKKNNGGKRIMKWIPTVMSGMVLNAGGFEHNVTIKCGAAATCGDVTGTEDAVRLPDHVGYQGILI